MTPRAALVLAAAALMAVGADAEAAVTVSKRFPGASAAPPAPHPAAAKHPAKHAARPVPRPAARAEPPRPAPPEPGIDLSHALPGKALAGLPSSAQQLKTLSSELKQGAPELADARQKSDTLAAEAAALRRKLIETAARIETLEQKKADADAQIVRLEAEDERLSAGFANDRVAVTRLLAVLERLQHDMPPALALRPGDALGAARSAMLVGASLPPVYAQAAQLSRRIDAPRRTRASLEQERREAADTAARLTVARSELDGLLAQKEREAQGAAETYGTLKARMETVAREAADFQALLARVRELRKAAPDGRSVVTVTAENSGAAGGLARNSLLVPVVGTAAGASQNGDPGITYATRAGAQVIAPADGKVLYAGPYHKDGQVLILEITTGYDVVLAGLGRVTVKLNDQLLAGEPVGTMPPDGADNRLYFELRHGGHGQSPAPWLRIASRPVVGRPATGKANGT